MAILPVKRGVDTKLGFTPADIAMRAADSEAPWLRQDAALIFFPALLAQFGGRSGAGQQFREAILTESQNPSILYTENSFGTNGALRTSPVGRGADFRGSGSRLRVDNYLSRDIGADEGISFLAYHRMRTLPSGVNAYGTRTYEEDDSSTPKLILGRFSTSNALRWQRGDRQVSSAEYLLNAPDRWVATHSGTAGGNRSRVWVRGQLSEETTDSDVVPVSDTFVFADADTRGDYGIFFFLRREVTAAEVQHFNADPYASFRRRPLLVPVSVDDGETASVTEPAGATDTWSALTTAPAALTEPAGATDAYNAIAAVGASLVEAVAAQDASGGPATALGAFTDSASADDLAGAVAQASAALTAGAAAGESWVAQAQAVADLVESGAAAETITASAADAERAALLEGSSAGDAFIAAIQAVASFTESASAADALVATVTAMVTLTESAAAGATFTASTAELSSRSVTFPASAGDAVTAVGQIITALQDGIAAGAIYAAAASVSAAITEGAVAGDTWSAVVPGTGYLVASAITITAALSGSHTITPALTGQTRIKPQE